MGREETQHETTDILGGCEGVCDGACGFYVSVGGEFVVMGSYSYRYLWAVVLVFREPYFWWHWSDSDVSYRIG